MATSIQAKIAPLPRGDYSSSATYAKLDVVSYNGSSYMAIKAVPTGTAPTNTTYWQLLAATATIPDGSISTSKLADGAVTLAKLDSSVSEVYAEVSGTYENMVVGSAEQLLSTQYDTDSVPYAFRKSPYGDREFDEIVGGTVAWNQWVVNGNFADTSNWSKSGVTMTVSGNVATLTSSSNGDHYSEQSYQNQIPVGHKVIYSADVKVDSIPSGESSVLALSFFYGYASYRDTYYATDTNWHTIAKVKNIEPTQGSNSRLVALRLECRKSTVTAQFRNAQLFDLTQMFGITVADYIYGLETNHTGDGVAFFRSLFSKSFYPYNSGELISVKGLEAHKTSVNLFKPEDVVSINYRLGADGYIYYTTDCYCSPFIPVDEGVTYFKNSPEVDAYHRYWTYNALQIPIRKVDDSNEITIQNGEAYVRFCGYTSEMYTTYMRYEITYPLDSSLTLCGVPKLSASNKLYFDGDIYSSDGSVQRRYKSLTFNGSEGWGAEDAGWQTGGLYAYYLSLNVATRGQGAYPSGTAIPNILTNNYVTRTYVDVKAGTAPCVAFTGNGAYIEFSSSMITTLADWKTWLSNNNMTIVYELAMPTTDSAEPYVNPQICDEYGTEEYVSAEQSGVTMIVGHNTKYPQNLRKKIEGLPWNFSSLIAPTEATNKATRNYTVGSFLIMNNTLYKVTSAIANGGTITVGSNVSATTIMQEILAL